MTLNEKILALRKQGYKIKTIAQKLGVSPTVVARICPKTESIKFKEFTPETCVYKNLRTWLNIHKINISDFCRKMDGNTNSVGGVGKILKGKHKPNMERINKMMKVTGLHYELLFEVDTNENQ